MKDPYSVKFGPNRTYKTSNGYEIVCQVFNAKNSFGGYVGDEVYYVRLLNGQVVDTQTQKGGADYRCASAAKGEFMTH